MNPNNLRNNYYEQELALRAPKAKSDLEKYDANTEDLKGQSPYGNLKKLLLSLIVIVLIIAFVVFSLPFFLGFY